MPLIIKTSENGGLGTPTCGLGGVNGIELEYVLHGKGVASPNNT
ncbi:hypothetical protein AVEN_211705-1, partial [Araneus ventricosus]